MLIKIQDTDIEFDPVRYAWIESSHITAITHVEYNREKIKIHLTCGKEYRADFECLIDIGKVLKLNIQF